MPMYKVVEYVCDACGERFDSLEDRGDIPPTHACRCGGVGSLVISGPKGKVCWGWAASRGKSDPPPTNPRNKRYWERTAPRD